MHNSIIECSNLPKIIINHLIGTFDIQSFNDIWSLKNLKSIKNLIIYNWIGFSSLCVLFMPSNDDFSMRNTFLALMALHVWVGMNILTDTISLWWTRKKIIEFQSSSEDNLGLLARILMRDFSVSFSCVFLASVSTIMGHILLTGSDFWPNVLNIELLLENYGAKWGDKFVFYLPGKLISVITSYIPSIIWIGTITFTLFVKLTQKTFGLMAKYATRALLSSLIWANIRLTILFITL